MLLFIFACSQNAKPPHSNITTWYTDVQPIVEQKCVRCHSSTGQGPGDFTSFEVVEQMAPLMLSSIDAGRMPPPVADPQCRDYHDSHTLSLSFQERDVIAQWIEDGLAKGDHGLEQDYDRSEFMLTDPDLVIKIQEPYTPTFSSNTNPGNEYRCFSVRHQQSEPFYITALHPIIDQPELVHHVVLAKGTANGILPGSDAPEGIDCIGNGLFVSGNFSEVGMLGAWAPGMSPIRFGDDAGLLVRPDEYIVIQMHYYASETEDLSDQSGYAFKTTTTPPANVIQMAPLGVTGFSIPAGAEDHTERTTLDLPVTVKLWGAFPHMHALGSGYHLSFENSDGTDQCLVSSDSYDFDNQLTYMFKEPIEVPAEQPIHWQCSWDNSAHNPEQMYDPPIDIGYGERTNEEMCFAFSLISL